MNKCVKIIFMALSLVIVIAIGGRLENLVVDAKEGAEQGISNLKIMKTVTGIQTDELFFLTSSLF